MLSPLSVEIFNRHQSIQGANSSGTLAAIYLYSCIIVASQAPAAKKKTIVQSTQNKSSFGKKMPSFRHYRNRIPFLTAETGVVSILVGRRWTQTRRVLPLHWKNIFRLGPFQHSLLTPVVASLSFDVRSSQYEPEMWATYCLVIHKHRWASRLGRRRICRDGF